MKEIIDEKDRKILGILQENASLSTHKISKKTLIPITTVNNRIKKLKNLGVIKKYTIDIDKSKLGFSLAAYIFVTLSLIELKGEGTKIDVLIKEIKKNPYIESVEHITGNVDMILKMHVKDINELNEYVVNTLNNLKGIERTNTAIILTKK